jgi:hypothetical protein
MSNPYGQNTQFFAKDSSNTPSVEAKRWKELAEDLMELVDMFACNNVDMKFYQRTRRAFERNIRG